jgi:hypothetical protein
MKTFIRTILVMLVTVTAAGVTYAGSDPANRDEKAVGILKQMDAYTDSMDKYVINAESYLDASIGPGLTVSDASDITVSVDRSGFLHSINKSGLETREVFMNKGKLTVFTGPQKFYSHAEIPATLDEGLMFALEQYGVETPAMDLLILRSLDELMTDEVEVVYVAGNSSIRGVNCHHILLSGPNVTMQLWIEKGDKPMPRRTLLTFKHGEGMPRHELFLKWTAKDSFDKSLFEFEPPEGAIEINFIEAQ